MDATGEAGEPAQPDQEPINSVWYRFTPSASGTAHFDTCTDVLYDGFMASYTGNAVDNLTNIAFNDDGCGGSGTGSVLDFPVDAGTTYSVAVDGWQSEVGDFTLTYSIPGGPPPPPPPPPPPRHHRRRHLRHHRRLRHLRRHLRHHRRRHHHHRLRRAAASRASSGCALAPRSEGSGRRTARSATSAAFARRRSLRGRVVSQNPRPGTIKRRNFPVKLAIGRR